MKGKQQKSMANEIQEKLESFVIERNLSSGENSSPFKPNESHIQEIDRLAGEYKKQLSSKGLTIDALEIFASKMVAANFELLDAHRDALKELSEAGKFLEKLIPSLNANLAAEAENQISLVRKQLAKAGGHAKHAADPKQAAKQQVRECWDAWQKKPTQYKSKSAFARDMLDKYESLESQRVIERWCKEWESEPS